jgi:hypothetical protein
METSNWQIDRVVEQMKRSVVAGVAVFLMAGAVSCSNAQERERAVPQVAMTAVPAELSASAPATAGVTEEEAAFYREAAAVAWHYMETNYQEATGLVNATPDWTHTTVWDVGGQILAFLSARDLGFLTQEEYDRRTGRLLQTLNRMELYRGGGFNKVYNTTNGARGTGREGWSATDLGRLLVALRVLAEREPQYAEEAERVVRRMNYRDIVKGGYVHGQMPGSRGQPWSFQEGRVGYEQYVARGFQLWGFDVGNALDLGRNSRPVEVMGVRILQDRRGLDRIVSDPFIMLGIELGMADDMREFAAGVLALQEARYRSTGQITMVNEDAMTDAPHYFYYYCAYCNGQPFVIDVSSPGSTLDEPRWVSTKAAFGWHAIMPSEYTQKALDHVAATARNERRGWASGVYEGSGKSTEAFNINTASVVLEVAAFKLRGGRPLIQK